MDYGADPTKLFFDRTAVDRARSKEHFFLLPLLEQYEEEYPHLSTLLWHEVKGVREQLKVERERGELLDPLMVLLKNPNSPVLVHPHPPNQQEEEEVQGDGGGEEEEMVATKMWNECSSSEFFGRGKCNPCPPNTLQSPYNQFECISCPPGSYLPLSTSKSCSSCANVLKGSFLNSSCSGVLVSPLFILGMFCALIFLFARVLQLEKNLKKLKKKRA